MFASAEVRRISCRCFSCRCFSCRCFSCRCFSCRCLTAIDGWMDGRIERRERGKEEEGERTANGDDDDDIGTCTYVPYI